MRELFVDEIGAVSGAGYGVDIATGAGLVLAGVAIVATAEVTLPVLAIAAGMAYLGGVTMGSAGK